MEYLRFPSMCVMLIFIIVALIDDGTISADENVVDRVIHSLVCC